VNSRCVSVQSVGVFVTLDGAEIPSHTPDRLSHQTLSICSVNRCSGFAGYRRVEKHNKLSIRVCEEKGAERKREWQKGV
jgi:hypothetical protein